MQMDFPTENILLNVGNRTVVNIRIVYMYGSWVRDDARNYAKTNAGISLDGKDDKFFVNIGNYRSINEYNYAKLLIRQSVMYLNTEQYFWEWKNDAQKEHIRNAHQQ